MTVWLEEGAIAHPNGLLLEAGRLVVGAWGTGMQDDFSTEGPGALLSVDLETRKIDTLVADLGNLDGLVRIGDVYLVSDWITGQLFEVSAEGASEVARYPAGLADIAAHENTLFLPSMLEGTVTARPYP